jgi:hypothetical protein
MSEYSIFNPRISRVIAFESVGAYTLHLTFDDQSERTIDFAPVLSGPIFGPLKDRRLFDQVKLDEDFGTLTWPNGADIAPNVLHDWPDHIEAIKNQHRQELAISQ